MARALRRMAALHMYFIEQHGASPMIGVDLYAGGAAASRLAFPCGDLAALADALVRDTARLAPLLGVELCEMPKQNRVTVTQPVVVRGASAPARFTHSFSIDEWCDITDRMLLLIARSGLVSIRFEPAHRAAPPDCASCS